MQMSDTIHIHSFRAEIAERKKASELAARQMKAAIQEAKDKGWTFPNSGK